MILPSRSLPSLLALTILFAQAACAAGPQGPAGRFSSSTAAVHYHVLAGELAAVRRQPERAAREFLAALELIPDTELAQRAAAQAQASGEAGLVQQAAQVWLRLDPQSLDARELLLDSALQTSDLVQAEAQCLGIVRGHAGGEAEGYRHCALALAQNPSRHPQGLQLLESLIGKQGETAPARYALGLLALRSGRHEQAVAAARRALELEPSFDDARLLLAGSLIKQGAIGDADRAAEPWIRSAASTADARMSYARLLIEARAVEAATNQLQILLQAAPDHVEARFMLGLMTLESQRLDDAASHLRAVPADSPRAREAAYYLGRIAQSRSETTDALEWYGRVTSGNFAVDALLRRADLLAANGRGDEAQTLLTAQRQRHPVLSPRIAPVQSELLMQAGRADEALRLLDEALDEQPRDGDLLYARSLVLEKLHRPERAEADLRLILAQDPDDARALNALGYLLTVHTTRYAEARTLITRALELEPDDPAIQDSMGWVLFRQGQAQAALVWLQKAYDRVQDAEIAAHLGEVLWTLGEKDRARQLWQAALQTSPEHAVLRETVERLSP